MNANNLAALPGKPQVWVVSERVHARLADAGLPRGGLSTVPNSVRAFRLVGQIQIESEAHRAKANMRVFMSSMIVHSPRRSTSR
jgi:F-type H+-transporting ATPase subunit gamma